MKRGESREIFGTPKWLDTARHVLADVVKTHADPDGRFSMCEVWTEAPPESVGASEGGRAAFHLRVEGTTSELLPGEVGDVDLKFVLSYETAVQAARSTFPDGSEESPPADEVEAPPAVEDGSPPAFEVQGDVTLMPTYMTEFHNRLVARTA